MSSKDNGSVSGRARPPAFRRWWLVLVAVAVVYFGFFALCREAFFPLGVHTFEPWFLDTFAILASNDAAAMGLDVHEPNPLDPFRRPHVYSHWWLGLGSLGLTRTDTPWIGAVLVLAFLVVALSRLRPREPRECGWYLVVWCAPSTLLAIERANNDLVVFLLLAPVVPCLLARSWWARLLPVLVIAIATGLKFYPAAAGLLLLVGDDARAVRHRLVLAVPVFAAVAYSLAEDLARVGTLSPPPEGLMTFGAAHLLAGFGLSGRLPFVMALGFAAIAIIAFWRAPFVRNFEIAPAARAEWLGFVLSAALLTGCFFTSTNFAYRWIFTLWLAPFLWRLMRESTTPATVRRLAATTAVLLLVMLWADPMAAVVLNTAIGRFPPAAIVTWADRFFQWEQPFAWAFFTCLIGFLTAFLRDRLRVSRTPAPS